MAAALASTLLKYHITLKLETILDKEAKISHEICAVQIQARLGSGEGSSAKGPDMKVWNKGKGLTVSVLLMPASNIRFSINRDFIGRLAIGRILLLTYCCISVDFNWMRLVIHCGIDLRHRA